MGVSGMARVELSSADDTVTELLNNLPYERVTSDMSCTHINMVIGGWGRLGFKPEAKVLGLFGKRARELVSRKKRGDFDFFGAPLLAEFVHSLVRKLGVFNTELYDHRVLEDFRAAIRGSLALEKPERIKTSNVVMILPVLPLVFGGGSTSTVVPEAFPHYIHTRKLMEADQLQGQAAAGVLTAAAGVGCWDVDLWATGLEHLAGEKHLRHPGGHHRADTYVEAAASLRKRDFLVVEEGGAAAVVHPKILQAVKVYYQAVTETVAVHHWTGLRAVAAGVSFATEWADVMGGSDPQLVSLMFEGWSLAAVPFLAPERYAGTHGCSSSISISTHLTTIAGCYRQRGIRDEELFRRIGDALTAAKPTKVDLRILRAFSELKVSHPGLVDELRRFEGLKKQREAGVSGRS